MWRNACGRLTPSLAPAAVVRRSDRLSPPFHEFLDESRISVNQDAADGFLHFSSAEQIVESAARHRAGQDGLVLLAVDADRLGAALKWEQSRGGALFPHLYGGLPLEAVVRVDDLPRGPDGRHVFPDLD